MKNLIKLITLGLLLTLLSIGYFSYSSTTVLSQGTICTGTVSYTRSNCRRDQITQRYSCVNNGTSTLGCSGGGVEYCMVAVSGSCSANSSGCSVETQTVGCSSFTPPTTRIYSPQPSVRPITQPPPTKPGAPPPSPGTPTPTPLPGPTYFCNTCTGQCEETEGGSSIQACQASCWIRQPGDPFCTGGELDAHDPNAGMSSCPMVEDLADSIEVKPGETIGWNTWEKPPGNTAAIRLGNESPGAVWKTYTSPGDMITLAYMFPVVEMQPRTFYVYDESDMTFYFYQGDGMPPVVFARNQEVVNRAVALGYTWIQNPTGTADSLSAARVIAKRVYKLIDPNVNEHPWKHNDGAKRGVLYHANAHESFELIPFVNCASLLSSEHLDHFYNTSRELHGDYGISECFRRQYKGIRFPKDNEEDEFTEMVMMGNYVGMENDWPRSNWRTTDSEGNLDKWVWPRINILQGNDLFKYGPPLQFGSWIRQAIMQIPTGLLLGTGEREFHAYISIGGGPNDNSMPVSDENSSSACKVGDNDVCDSGVNHECAMKDRYDVEQVQCKNLKLVDSAGNIINPGGKVKIGQTYTISSNARSLSRLYHFYNAHFNDPSVNSDPVGNWIKAHGINEFGIVDCGSNCITNPDDPTDTKILRATRNTSVSDGNGIHSGFVDTGSNVTGNTFEVEFWARVDGTQPKTIANTLIYREPYSPASTTTSYAPISDPGDTRGLRFPVQDIGNTTTPSITVTNQWQKFYGTATFNYVTDHWSAHPSGSLSTRVRVILAVPEDGTRIYYDNVNIVGYKQPTVYYRMASALTPDESPSFNQCSQSTQASGTYTNLSGGLFSADLTIPGDRAPGRYNIFAALQEGPKVYFGNPGATTNCGLNRNSWDDVVANTCNIPVEIVSCDNQTPGPPAVSQLNNVNNSLPNSPGNPIETRFNDVRIINNTLVVTAVATGTTNQINSVTAMTMFLEPYNTASPNGTAPSNSALVIDGELIHSSPGSRIFRFLYPLQGQFTNELTIFLQAINENACNESGELVSDWYKRNIRLMQQRRGHLINVPKEQYSTYTCTDNTATLASRGDSDWIVDIGNNNLANFTTMEMNVQTTHTFNPIRALYSGTLHQFKALSFSTAGLAKYYITDFPYNPSNDNLWRNKVGSFTLNLPQSLTEESFVCLKQCNPNINTSNPLFQRCQAGDSVAAMAIPKPGAEFNTNDLNIYVSKGNFADAWWQARGGLVFANGTVLSKLPLFNGAPRTLCQDQRVPDICIPFITARSLVPPPGQGSYDTHTSGGFVITNSSSVSTGTGTSYLSQNPGGGTAPVSMNSNITDEVMNEKIFDTIFPQLDEQKTNPLTVAQLPTMDSTTLNAAKVYDANDDLVVYTRTGTLEINLDIQRINVPANKKVVIFVEGNVDIYNLANSDNVRSINVENGGFLAIIASGNIVFEHNVGHFDNLFREPAVKGIFLGQNITVRTNGETLTDKKFIGEGSFIGLAGVNLLRKYDSDDEFDREKNSASPVEQFIFSPSLVAATPNLLRQSNLTWKEAN